MNLGLPEMIFIFLLALIIFGPKKLPEIGKQIGKAMNEFKRASNEFKSQIEGEIRTLELEETLKKEATPQILPPQNTVPVTGSAGESAEGPHSVSSNPDETHGGMNSAATQARQEEGGINSAATQVSSAPAAAPANGAAKDSPEQAKAADV